MVSSDTIWPGAAGGPRDDGPLPADATAAATLEGFLGYLSPRERDELLALGTERAYGAGTFLLLEGDPGNHVILLLSGRVKAFIVAPDGDRVLLALRGPGDVLGEMAAIEPESTQRTATIEAMEPTTARVLSAAELTGFLARRPSAAIALLRDVRDRLRNAERMRMEAVTYDTMARVTRQLAVLAARYGVPAEVDDRVALRISQAELAGWVGASRESIARAMKSLRKRNLVATGYRSIEVIDLAALQAAADGR
jgi:CRP-like cAMP-binding protein